MKKLSMVFLIFFGLAVAVNAQKRLALSPVHAIGLDESAIVTTESLLKMELQKQFDYDVIQIPFNDDQQPCYDEKCAIELGKNAAADEVVLCRLSRLGEKIIIQFIHLDVGSGQTLFADNTTSDTIEDLDTVMKRVALSIARREPIAKTAEVGNITESEDKKPLRRSAHKVGGFSFGYLYPQNGYDNKDRSFALDFRTGYDMENVSTGMLIAVRNGFATNLYVHYLTTRTDVCPYFGGAFGFHWIAHDDDGYYDADSGNWTEDKRDGDGFEFTLTSGIRIFRTYNFQLIANLDYSITFNDFDDKAIVFTLGLLK
ncbi:MAG: hypothetical protein DWQ10_17290 [Calditrichaeota bacterium]|nr:MAG: hypothetical protein DWQ10_17290 [Calditrichota bacterium]